MKRKSYLDILRVIAIFAVVLLHTVSSVTANYASMMTSTQIGVYNAIKSLCTFCVPVFVMISGALFLDPDKEITIKNLFGKYIRRLVLALFLFGFVYCEIELVVDHKGFWASDLPLAFKNVLTGNSWAHMWYLYMLVGIYLIIPVLKGFVAYASKSAYTYILILLLIFQVALPDACKLLKMDIGIHIPISSIYVFYFLAGYYLAEYVRKTRTLCICSSILGAGSAVYIIASCVTDYKAAFHYDSPAIVLLSVCLFSALSCCQRESQLCRKLHPFIFGIYLIHTFFLNIFYKGLHVTPLSMGGYVLILPFAIVTLILSFIAVWIMRKIPFMEKWIL